MEWNGENVKKEGRCRYLNLLTIATYLARFLHVQGS